MKEKRYRNTYRDNNRNRKPKKFLPAILLLLVLFAGIFALAKVAEKGMESKAGKTGPSAASFESTDEEDFEFLTYLNLYDEDYCYHDDIVNYLVIGTDDRDATIEERKYSMADFFMLLSINRTKETYSVLELNRDTVTTISMLNSEDEQTEEEEMQLCTAFAYGSETKINCENTVDVVSEMLGMLPIEGYYQLPMTSIAKLNGLVGGVPVTIEEDLTAADPAFTKGAELTLTDVQAEAFVRARMGVSNGENDMRMTRQRVYVDSFLAQIRAKSDIDNEFPLQVFHGLKDDACTTVKGDELNELLQYYLHYENKGSYRFDGETTHGMTYADDKEEHAIFEPDEESVISVMTEIFSLTKDE